MPSVQISDVITLAQQKLGDDAGELFTSAILFPHVKSAYRDMGRLLVGVKSPRAKRVHYVRILANTSSFTPDYNSTLPNFQAPAQVDERAEDSSLSISTVSGAGTDAITVATSVPHNLSIGTTVMLVGTNVRWLDGAHTIVAVPTTSSFTVRGTLAVANATPLGPAVVSIASAPFLPVGIISLIPQWPATPFTRVAQIAFTENGFNFAPPTSNRQMRLMYDATADDIATVNDLIGFDDALDFLAVAGASYAAGAKGAMQKAESLEVLAFGPSRNRFKAEGGLAHSLMAAGVRAMQQQQWARPPWRRRPLMNPFPVP